MLETAKLELHFGPHGDVCRLEDNNYFCIPPCKKITNVPWCAYGQLPCRVAKNSVSAAAAPTVIVMGMNESITVKEIRDGTFSRVIETMALIRFG